MYSRTEHRPNDPEYEMMCELDEFEENPDNVFQKDDPRSFGLLDEPKELTEDQIRLTDLLGTYYENFFPCEQMYRLLNYGRLGKFYCREFAYTLVQDDTMNRNISFNNCREMEQHCREHAPLKIDIGACYNTSPGAHDSIITVKPIERELVFDIDLSDYNNVRNCCTDANICPKCWKFAAIACKILDTSFRDDFGWQLILWVFSGRRGIHCWVCDRDARQLSSKARKHITEFYRLDTEFGKRIDLGSKSLHYHIRRSYEIAMLEFESMCVRDQNILGTAECVKQFLSLIPRGFCRDNARQLFEEQATSIERWTAFFRYWESQKKARSKEWEVRPYLLEEIVLYYTYPRLDSEVTVGLGHLLKSPFSPHPTTHKLCTPFDPMNVDEFDVNAVPTLHDIVDTVENPDTSIDLFLDANVQKYKYEESLRIFKDFVERAEAISYSEGE